MALAAHLRDQDDLHYSTVSHPGGVVWSAIAACALEQDVTVGDAIVAAALGYELTVRIAEAAGPEHRQRWHVTATAGTVGAAGAAAHLLGSDDQTTFDAVAHAASIAGGAAHAIVERSATRFLHRAHAVTNGLSCARAACAGKRGSRRILDDGRGTFVFSKPEVLTSPRRVTALEETGFRLHPTTGFAQSAVDAALSLTPGSEIEHVYVGVSQIAYALASNPRPRDDDESWWSIESAVAATLGTEIGRVEVQPTAANWASTVEVRLQSGSTRGASIEEPVGHPDRPASDADLRAKWERLNDTEAAEPFERIASADDRDGFGTILRDILDSVG